MKNKNAIQKRVITILAKHLGWDEDKIKLDSKLQDDLQADSLDIVEIIMALENEFNINVPDKCSENLITVQDIITYLEKNT